MHAADKILGRRKTMKSAIFLLASALAASAVPAWAEDWHNASNYPARAVAFNFGSGVLDSNHSVRFGSWTVSFGAHGLPTMIAKDSGGKYYVTGFPPYPLVCTNAVSGQAGCAIFLYLTNPNRCDLAADDFHFSIPCPASITFQR
jgi:hypothetical protein